ncbi:MAG: hypothetical protein JRJ73_01340, partial [Deltaproteobacteria bacterium]|nr:hypothetical protein [Deltaproteobacteria bacterium]
KSTLDLVMEKTKDMVLSDEDKQEVLNRERENRACGLLLKLKQGQIKPDDLPQIIDKLEEEAAPVKRMLLELMVEELSLGGENDSTLTGIRILSPSTTGDAVKRIEDLFQEYDQSVIDLTAVYRKKLLDDLKDQGISGSAVIPKVDQDPAWAEARAGMKTQFEARFNQVKSALIDASQSA